MFRLKKKAISASLAAIMVCTAAFNIPATVSAASTVGVTYKTQVQRIGWQSPVSNGTQAGTTGEALRLEALTVSLNNAPGATISYRVQVQHYGWMTHVTNGKVAGTVGKALRVEAIRISIAGLPGYEVQYMAYVQRQGWDKSWKTVKNGTSLDSAPYAGTVGKSLRIEAIKIRLVKLTSWAGGSWDNYGNAPVYKVGTDIPAGEYAIIPTDSGSGTMFQVANDYDGNDVVSADGSAGREIITLTSGQYISFLGGTMYSYADTRVPKADISKGPLTEGMYKVGTDLPAGTYTITPADGVSDGGYYIYRDSKQIHDDSVVTSETITSSTSVTLSDGQYVQLLGCTLY